MTFRRAQIQEIEKACRRFSVKSLHVFGSFLSPDFSDSSDIDFLVEFNRRDYSGAFDQYSDFKDSLEQILGRPVDLVCANSIRNAVFKKEAESTKDVVYAA